MRNSLREMFRIKELNVKLAITLGLLILTRIGTVIPIPGIDPIVLRNYFELQSSGFVDYLDFFSGGAFSQFSIFMLGVMPYISAQIILQLLMIIVPSLKKLSKEPAGAKKIQKYTRWGSIAVCLFQASAVVVYAFTIPGAVVIPKTAFIIMALLVCTAGSMSEIWIGDRITAKGIGNGISLLIFAGIVARYPSAIFGPNGIIACLKNGTMHWYGLVVLVVMYILLVILVVYEEKGQKKISVTYSKRVIGRKIYGGQSNYIPLKINPSGVIPVIFASAILTLPIQLATTLGPNVRWLQTVGYALRQTGPWYICLSTLLIITFAFFYTQVTLNPVEIAKNIRDNGGVIQGVRADKMESYLTKILNRIVLPGAIFLAFIALVPTLVQLIFKYPENVAILFGGTSLIIVVGVTLETMRSIEGIMKMHHSEGFSKKGL